MIKSIISATILLMIVHLNSKASNIFNDNYILENEKDNTTLEPGDYYISSSTGDDSNDGSITSPWKTLDKISNTILVAGKTVFFKKGDTFVGHFVVNGSGTIESPITITSYGTGNQPIITGAVGSAFGGDHREAILVENNQYIVFNDIEVQNERTVSKSGVNDLHAYGIQILNSGPASRILKGFTFQNLTLRNVYSLDDDVTPEEFDEFEVAGIRIFTAWRTIANPASIQDILVEDCYFEDIQRLGVHIKHGGSNTTVETESRNINVVCRNNTFKQLGGTSILPQGVYNCLIENNMFDRPGSSVDFRMPGRGSSVWTIKCINSVIQYNNCISTRGYFDSHGIHIDLSNKNTFIQYNYMEDCEGGFVEILSNNLNSVYRYNVSVNDGWRSYGGADGTWSNSNHTIWVQSTDGISSHNYIYNNTVIKDESKVIDINNEKKTTTAIDLNGQYIYVFNNIFRSINGSGIGTQQAIVNHNGTEAIISNNLFEGNFDIPWSPNDFPTFDSNKIQANPLFVGTGTDKAYYQLTASSPAIDTGMFMSVPEVQEAGTGIFANVKSFPEVDIFGNVVYPTGKINIGADNNYSTGMPLSVNDFDKFNQSLIVYPTNQGTGLFLKFNQTVNDSIVASLYDITGKILHSNSNKLTNTGENTFIMDLDFNLSNGIYILKIKNGNQFISRKVMLFK